MARKVSWSLTDQVGENLQVKGIGAVADEPHPRRLLQYPRMIGEQLAKLLQHMAELIRRGLVSRPKTVLNKR